jgi:hypothetical protein
MADKKYSKVYNFEGRKYRYNFEECVLEWVHDEDCKFDENDELIFFKIPLKVADCIGLSKDGWNNNKMDYIAEYHAQIDEEVLYM